MSELFLVLEVTLFVVLLGALPVVDAIAWRQRQRRPHERRNL